MNRTLHVATYNIHKGFSQFNRRMMIHELRDMLRGLHADVVFLQEVVGGNLRHPQRFHNWPTAPQHEFLAEETWGSSAYGMNAVYEEGHHGNAVLSRFPISRWENRDISAHRFESRGLLHCEVQIPGWDVPLHCINVHLGLFAAGRRKQYMAVRDHIRATVPAQHPLIIAGDFNDWQAEAEGYICEALGVRDAFMMAHGRRAKSFPVHLPLLPLDRIYVRGFQIKQAEVHFGHPWTKISDHAALAATLVRA